MVTLTSPSYEVQDGVLLLYFKKEASLIWSFDFSLKQEALAFPSSLHLCILGGKCEPFVIEHIFLSMLIIN